MNFLSHLAFEATNWFETIFAHWSPGRSKPASQQITAVNAVSLSLQNSFTQSLLN